MEHTRMAAVAIYHCQSQHTMAIPRPPAPLFSSLGGPDKVGALAVVRQGGPSIVVAVFQKTLLGSMEQTRMAAVAIYHCQSQHTMAIPRPPAPFFPSLGVLTKSGIWML